MPLTLRGIATLAVALAISVPATVAVAAVVDSGPNPLERFPRRPGAKQSDVELRSGDAYSSDAFTARVARLERRPRTSEPRDLVVATTTRVEEFSPRIDERKGDDVHLVLRGTLIPALVDCSLTRASDGAVAVAHVRKAQTRDYGVLTAPPTKSHATRQTTATAPRRVFGTSTVQLWFRVGSSPDEFYLRCLPLSFTFAFADLTLTTPVWRIDV